MSTFELDTRAILNNVARASAQYANYSFLAREVGLRMHEQLEYLKNTPHTILDLGCGQGADFSPLKSRYPQAQLLGLDFSYNMLQHAQPKKSLMQRLLASKTTTQLICAQAAQIPLASSSLDMVWSNLLLNWFAQPDAVLREIHRILKVDSVFIFSSLGPDTLKELRSCLPQTQGKRVHQFIDMHDLGDALVHAGFAEPVMSMEKITLTYAQFDDLLKDLRFSGSQNASSNRPKSLSGKHSWQHAREAYEKLRLEERLPATFEVIFGHAWKAAAKKLPDGRAIIQFQGKNHA